MTDSLDDFPIEVARPFIAAAEPYQSDGGDMIVPDFLGEITAWRVWRVMNPTDARGIRLQSLGAGGAQNASVWTPGKRMEAYCGKTSCETPGEKCSCGFYAATTREHLLSMSYHRGFDFDNPLDILVIGTVKMSGKIIPGTLGWRAQRARPSEVLVPFARWKVVKPLQETYGPSVKVKLNNFLQGS